MSYDLRFAVKVDGTDLMAVIGEPQFHSPTYNISTLLRQCTGWDFHQHEWYKLTDVIPYIRHGLEELRTHPAEYKQYESPNGWGTIVTAEDALQSIADWIEKDRKWSWNEHIPLEHIYIAW